MRRQANAESGPRFIDLHAHTNESDGSLSPAALVEAAYAAGLSALAITDHDTLSGYQSAAPIAEDLNLDLVCGIELNTRLSDRSSRSVHLLAYFPKHQPSSGFLAWLEEEREERRSRNMALAASLQARNIQVTLDEAEARGRSLTGRPHFASLLIEKGYVRTHEEAFDKYLGEDSPTFVPRQSKTTREAITIVREGGGLPVIAHPVRLNLGREEERSLLADLAQAGLVGLEIYHSEHSPELQAYYHQLALSLGLLPTGGSDFHGAIKPDIQLATGRNGNVRVPFGFLESLRAFQS